MSKYGMTEEEYKLFLEKDPWDEVDGWIEYCWSRWEIGDYDYAYMYFPNEKVATAYFAAQGIRDYGANT